MRRSVAGRLCGPWLAVCGVRERGILAFIPSHADGARMAGKAKDDKTKRPDTLDEATAKTQALEPFRASPSRPEADHESGRADRRQPELAAGRRARADAARGLSSCARRSRTSTTSGSPSASSTRAAPARTATSRSTSRWPSITRARVPADPSRARRRCSCASRRSAARAARPIRRATCAASPSSSTPQEGNWDLVGNNMPVFFIQDAIKFPDLVHAVKPEPHNEIPQAASAHDTFWDFVSLTPESRRTWCMWVMSRPRHPALLRA